MCRRGAQSLRRWGRYSQRTGVGSATSRNKTSKAHTQNKEVLQKPIKSVLERGIVILIAIYGPFPLQPWPWPPSLWSPKRTSHHCPMRLRRSIAKQSLELQAPQMP
jgi:hypothetical protein